MWYLVILSNLQYDIKYYIQGICKIKFGGRFFPKRRQGVNEQSIRGLKGRASRFYPLSLTEEWRCRIGAA